MERRSATATLSGNEFQTLITRTAKNVVCWHETLACTAWKRVRVWDYWKYYFKKFHTVKAQAREYIYNIKLNQREVVEVPTDRFLAGHSDHREAVIEILVNV